MHLVLHWLDDLRGAFGLATFSWNSVRGNIGALPWQVVLTAPITILLWPRLRHWVTGFIHQHITNPLKAHVSAENRQLHAKVELLSKKHDQHTAKLDLLLSHYGDNAALDALASNASEEQAGQKEGDAGDDPVA